MMASLFSMFDPTALLNLPLNWLMLFCFIFLPINMWKLESRTTMMINLLMKILNNEFKILFSKNILMKGSSLLFCSLFIMITISNLVSNFPYTFCSSAHLVFSFSLSLPVWTSLTVFYWFSLTKSMLGHLVPVGTPSPLMPLMVMIEITSTIIRPMALGIRLSANLIAGHLLMALLGNSLNFPSLISIFIILIQTSFLTFELMVAMIQSYVFSVLMTLYSSEMS